MAVDEPAPASRHLERLRGARLLISGINGFLGCHVAVAAVRAGAVVAGLDRPGSADRGDRIRAALGGAPIDCRDADLELDEAWNEAIAALRPDAVLHLAGATGRGSGTEAWNRSVQGNLLTTSNLVRALLALDRAERCPVLYPGSQLEYGAAPAPWTENSRCRPEGSYAATKLAATEMLLALARNSDLKVGVARFPIVFGPGQAPTMFIPELICTALSGAEFRMTDGRQRRRLTYAGDAAALLLEMTEALLDGTGLPPLLNAPASDPVSMRRVARNLAALVGGNPRLAVGALPRRPGEADEAWPDDGLARSLGFDAGTPIDEALRATVEWYRANPWFSVGEGS